MKYSVSTYIYIEHQIYKWPDNVIVESQNIYVIPKNEPYAHTQNPANVTDMNFYQQNEYLRDGQTIMFTDTKLYREV